MGNTVFNDRSDVGIFFALVLMTFTEIFVGVINTNRFTRNKEWYNAISIQIKGMPPPFLFPVIWSCIYILIVASIYTFYRNALFPNTGYLIDTVTILFVLNILSNKFWVYVFFDARKTLGALLLVVFIVCSNIVIVILFGINNLWVEFGTFLPYVLWCFYAMYINIMWLYIEMYTLPVSTSPLSMITPLSTRTPKKMIYRNK